MKLRIAGFEIDTVFLFILLCPVFFFMNHLNPDLNNQQVMCMQYLAAVMLAVSMPNIWIGGFLILALSHFFLLPTPGWLDYIMPLFFGCLVYNRVYNCYTGTGYRYAILAVLVFNLLIALFQWLHFPLFSQQFAQICGWMTLPSFFGMFCAITAPLILTINPWLILLSIIGVLVSKSTFSVLAMCAGIGFYLYHMYPRMRPVVIYGIIAAAITAIPVVEHSFHGSEYQRRFHVWSQTASKAFRSPFVGVGAGGSVNTKFMEVDDQYFQVDVKPENEPVLKAKLLELAHKRGIDTTRLEAVHFNLPGGLFNNLDDSLDELRGRGMNAYIWAHSHNEYLQVFLEFGLVGLILVTGFIWHFFARFRPWMAQETVALMSSFLATLVVSLAHFPLYMVRTGAIIVVLTAILDRRLGDAA